MAKVKSKRIIVAAILLLCGVLSTILLVLNSGCKEIQCINFKNQNEYKVKEVYEKNNFIYRALYENGDFLLKTEIRSNYTNDDAKQIIETQLVRTKGLFEDAAAPYPGELSDVIACSNAYKPVYSSRTQDGINFSSFDGYVNKRLVFGSCADDQAEYHDTLTMFYCPTQKKFYQLEIIIPNKKYKQNPKLSTDILESISCGKQ